MILDSILKSTSSSRNPSYFFTPLNEADSYGDATSQNDGADDDYEIQDDSNEHDNDSSGNDNAEAQSDEQNSSDDDGAEDNYEIQDDDDSSQQDDTDQGDNQNTGDDQTDGGDDDYEVQDDDSTDDDGSDGTDQDTSSDGDSSGMDDSDSPEEDTNDPRAKLNQLEKSIFDQLSPDQQKAKTTELKGLYQMAYDNCQKIIDSISNTESTPTNAKVFDYIISRLTDLKGYISDYLRDVFDSKGYLENMTEFQKYLVVFDTIKHTFDDIQKEKQDQK